MGILWAHTGAIGCIGLSPHKGTVQLYIIFGLFYAKENQCVQQSCYAATTLYMYVSWSHILWQIVL